MSVLNPTPRDRLVDAQGRPYFLWDSDMTLDQFQAALQDPAPGTRAYYIGKLMRQAKPDDVFIFVSTGEIDALWERLERYLGRTRPFWTWLRAHWRARDSPGAVIHGDVTIWVDTAHEILVNKLCALLSRSELRDLRDVEVLLAQGGDLERALADAPRKDGGFSPLTLAWILETFDLSVIAARDGLPPAEIESLERFRKSLVELVTEIAVPR